MVPVAAHNDLSTLAKYCECGCHCFLYVSLCKLWYVSPRVATTHYTLYTPHCHSALVWHPDIHRCLPWKMELCSGSTYTF